MDYCRSGDVSHSAVGRVDGGRMRHDPRNGMGAIRAKYQHHGVIAFGVLLNVKFRGFRVLGVEIWEVVWFGHATTLVLNAWEAVRIPVCHCSMTGADGVPVISAIGI